MKKIISLSLLLYFNNFCYANSEKDYQQEIKALKTMDGLTSLFEIRNKECSILIVDNKVDESFQCDNLLLGNFFYDQNNVMLQFIDLKKENTIGLFLHRKNRYNYTLNNFFSPNIDMEKLDSIRGKCNIKDYNVSCHLYSNDLKTIVDVDFKQNSVKDIKNGL